MLGSAVRVRLAAPTKSSKFMASKSIPWDRTKGRPEPIAALNRILEKENGEPLVDMHEYCPSLRLIRPAAIMFCRLGVAERVERAAQSLPKGYHLGLIEAWRPIERQERIFNLWFSNVSEASPGKSYQTYRRMACRWAAPTDQKAPPGHCTGAALDVHLVDDNDEPFDVVSPYQRFQAARTYTIGLTNEAQENRMILVNAMLAQGFSNCRDEWWHYSYGDAGWAVRFGYKECFYGLVKMDPDSYAENEKLWIEQMKERVNPFEKQRPLETSSKA